LESSSDSSGSGTCYGPVHFEGQKFQDEEEVGQGEDGVEAGVGCFGEKALGGQLCHSSLGIFSH
jgi:hypothetical protein